MKILTLHVFKGANIFSYKPVVWIKLDLEDAYDTPSVRIGHFNETLLSLFPGLYEHKCSLGVKGGFVKRLQEGTYLAHIFEHTLLELQNTVGEQVAYGKARATEEKTVYDVIAAYKNEAVVKKCARLVEKALNSLLQGKSIRIEGEIEEIKRLKAEVSLGPSAQAIYDAAVRRSIPVRRFADEDMLLLGQGKYSHKIWSTVTDQTSLLAADLVGNKYLTTKLLESYGIPVPKNKIAENEEEAAAFAEKIGKNVVIKPLNGSHGRGVTIGADTKQELCRAFRFAAKYGGKVLVEEYIAGRQYRLCLVNHRFVAAAERIPAYVIGDGHHTVRELVEFANKNPLRGEAHDKPLTKITLDKTAAVVLAKQGLTPEQVPEVKRVVKINETANISTGGTAVDVTAIVHPDNIRLAEYVSQAVGLDIVGLDIISGDITRPLYANGGAVIEVNAAPGIRMHHHPSAGQARDVGGEIIEYLYPRQSDGRIPVVAVTGTNGKTTAVRMIAGIFRQAGYNAGMTTTEGVFLNDQCLLKGDCSGPMSAQALLANPKADMVVLETARGGLVRAGLGFDACDVGLVTNISEDHLGQDGIETLEDLAYVKSLVLEMIRPGGAAVINADDKFAPLFAGRTRADIVYFSARESNMIVRRHLGLGGRAVFLKDGWIYLAVGGEGKKLLHIHDLPVSFEGMARHNVENALAAAGAAFAYGIAPEAIQKGLENFAHNTGRLNMFDFGFFRVCVDYGHNLAGYEAMIQTARRLRPKRLVGVIAAPGDRRDELLFSLGAAAGKGFDFLYIKEDADLRGRRPGETAGILRRGALAGGFKDEGIKVVLPEADAVRQALQNAAAGDLILIFYENYDTVMRQLQSFLEGEEESTGLGLLEGAALPLGTGREADLRKNFSI